MGIVQFAEENRLKVVRDDCNDQVIQGKRGNIHQDAGGISVYVANKSMRGMKVCDDAFLKFAKKTQNADIEAVYFCDPSKLQKDDISAILKFCRIRQKKQFDAETLQKMRARGAELAENLRKTGRKP